MFKKLTLSSALLLSLISFKTSSLSAQLPLYVNMGSTNTCGNFDMGVDLVGDYAPGDHAFVSGNNLQVYAPASHMSQPRPDACMYGSELFAEGDSDLTLNYCSLTPNEDMLLTLHFEEIYAGIQAAGVRQFDIVIQGTTVLSNFDIYAEADALNGGNGGNNIPVDKTFSVTADASGCLKVVLKDIGMNNPKINGISLEAATAFPVEFLSFNAQANVQNGVDLFWETATELNNAGFQVQYSTDGSNYTNAGFVDGVGNSQNIESYNFSLPQMEAGNYIFRLKQIDIDGAFAYSQSVEVAVEEPGSFSLGQVYPNPATTYASVELKINQTQKISAQLLDLQGRVIATPFEGTIRENTLLNIELDIENQPAGLYLLRIKGTKGSITQKFFKK
ncbi:MAG: T9SS type A sorting domain-containing protein [Bacteroidota bacterium]